MLRRLLPDFFPVKTEECGVVMTFEHSEKCLKPITLMCGDVKGIYVAELKINQGHNYFIKCNKNKYIITNFDQLRS